MMLASLKHVAICDRRLHRVRIIGCADTSLPFLKTGTSHLRTSLIIQTKICIHKDKSIVSGCDRVNPIEYISWELVVKVMIEL